jgi:hypothetical protein
VCVYVCMCVSVQLCVYVYILAHMYDTLFHPRIHTCSHPHTHTHTNINTHRRRYRFKEQNYVYLKERIERERKTYEKKVADWHAQLSKLYV